MKPMMLLLGSVLALAAMPAMAAPRPVETVAPNFAQAIPNIPGKSLVAVVVTYPPGGASLAHRHASSAFIYAYVLEGEIRSSVDDGPVHVYRTGESWYEAPGAHHVISENASNIRPARLLAVFVVDSADKKLTMPDHE